MPTRTGNEIRLIIAVVTIVSAWITGIRMRRRIKRALGRKATKGDLTSIDTWMKVEEKEAKKGKPLNPN